MLDNEVFQGLETQFMAWLPLAGACLILALLLSLFLRRRGIPVFPPRRLRPVPWTGQHILLIVVLCYVVWPILVHNVVAGVQVLLHGTPSGVPAPSDIESNGSPAHQLDDFRSMVWDSLILYPLNCATLITILARLGINIPVKIGGVFLRRIPETIVAAAIAWLFVTPPVILVDFAAELGYLWWMGHPAESHPFVVLAEHHPSMLDMSEITMLALLGAPIWEETFFRGLLQPWFASRRWGTEIGLSFAPVVAWLTGWQHHGSAPVLYALAMMAVYVLLNAFAPPVLGRPSRVIYVSALLFAAAHSEVWPTPIPLFILGLALGYLAYRTQSLAAPILLHGLFNCIALLALLYGLLAPPPTKGSDTTSAASLSPAAHISTRVPATSYPRRT
jgi:membrane protease YdiL (CAAX protease family)